MNQSAFNPLDLLDGLTLPTGVIVALVIVVVFLGAVICFTTMLYPFIYGDES